MVTDFTELLPLLIVGVRHPIPRESCERGVLLRIVNGAIKKQVDRPVLALQVSAAGRKQTFCLAMADLREGSTLHG